ncbi:MAG: hypothetical protein O3B24_01510 [Verrucomicrobia bacterium]|nr:hypothetical protein [Verrucomicrobiota bacterium]
MFKIFAEYVQFGFIQRAQARVLVQGFINARHLILQDLQARCVEGAAALFDFQLFADFAVTRQVKLFLKQRDRFIELGVFVFEELDDGGDAVADVLSLRHAGKQFRQLALFDAPDIALLRQEADIRTRIDWQIADQFLDTIRFHAHRATRHPAGDLQAVPFDVFAQIFKAFSKFNLFATDGVAALCQEFQAFFGARAFFAYIFRTSPQARDFFHGAGIVLIDGAEEFAQAGETALGTGGGEVGFARGQILAARLLLDFLSFHFQLAAAQFGLTQLGPGEGVGSLLGRGLAGKKGEPKQQQTSQSTRHHVAPDYADGHGLVSAGWR